MIKVIVMLFKTIIFFFFKVGIYVPRGYRIFIVNFDENTLQWNLDNPG